MSISSELKLKTQERPCLPKNLDSYQNFKGSIEF